MPVDPAATHIYHITDITNLDGIFTKSELLSDALMRKEQTGPTEIGYSHIKDRRLTQYRIGCCKDRFVAEFVPFYFCPRSPMLFTINKGGTGRPAGCQTSILHLVSTVQHGYNLRQPWAISDGNAGANYTTFANDNDALERVNWEVVKSTNWAGERLHTKSTEFLVADRFPIAALIGIGCHNEDTAIQTREIVRKHGLAINVKVFPHWYY